jgi:ParB/RepB/Spo0J family partition protein
LSHNTTIALERIHVPANVRQLDSEHVKALAASIALQGLLVPLVVCPAGREAATAGFEYELVAGFHRHAAAVELQLADVPAVVREAGQHAADRAVENITRLALRADEEAVAVAAMLDRGLSEDGAAQALGWPKARVTARIKLLELPESARELVGSGVIALSAVDQLRAIGRVAPDLLEAVIEFLAEGNEWAAERLAREPGWVLDSALRHGKSKAFAAHLTQLDSYEIGDLRLGKKVEELLEEATGLRRQLDRYSYGAPAIRFSEEDVDQARAAGVLIEFENGRPMIVDRALYRELAKGAIKRTVEQLREKTEHAAAEKKRSAKRGAGAPADPVEEARREHGRALREIAEQAHGANLDLGASLITNLAVVDPGDMTVARFFVYALLGSDYDNSPYTQSGDLVADLAGRGVRLVVEQFRTDVTKTRKDGSRGKLRIDYGGPRKSEEPIAWLWKFIDGAKTAGELYGRALVVIAAEQYASRLVLPASQRLGPERWSSHKDHAAKALAKLAGPHLPSSLKQLEKAIEQANRDRQAAERKTRQARKPARAGSAGADAPGEAMDEVDEVDEELEAAA